MKRFFIMLLLAAVLITGCGKKDEDVNDETVSSESVQEENSEAYEGVESTEDVHADDDYAVAADKVTLGSLEMVQVEGDDERILAALNTVYKDADGTVSVYFEDWDDDFYYVEDYTNRRQWRISRDTFVIAEGWDPAATPMPIVASVTVDLQPVVDSLDSIATVDDLYAKVKERIVSDGLTNLPADLLVIDSYTLKTDKTSTLLHLANSDIAFMYLEDLDNMGMSNELGSDYPCIIFDSEMPDIDTRKVLYEFLASPNVKNNYWLLTCTYSYADSTFVLHVDGTDVLSLTYVDGSFKAGG